MYSRPLPDRHPFSDFFFSEGRGRLYTGYLERIIPSSNCPSKLTDKVRRIVHSKLKLFHFQIKTYYLSDANHQTDNPSHTNNPSLMWKRPFCYNECRAPALSWAFACLLEVEYFIKKYDLSNVKIFQKNSLFLPKMTRRPLFWFKDTKMQVN